MGPNVFTAVTCCWEATWGKLLIPGGEEELADPVGKQHIKRREYIHAQVGVDHLEFPVLCCWLQTFHSWDGQFLLF